MLHNRKKEEALKLSEKPRDQQQTLYNMLHPFSPYLVSVLYLYNFFYPSSPQKAKLDMLTLDRHQSEQASIIFINTLHTRIEPPTIRFTNYPSSGSKLGFPQLFNSTCSLADAFSFATHTVR
jgi:hypothetical protein